MAWLAQNWIWWLVAVVLIAIGFAFTRGSEVRQYRLGLVVSLLVMEVFVWTAVKVNSIIGLVLLAVGGRMLMRLCAPALSHIMTQLMADKVTDMLYGGHEAPLPSMEFNTVRKLREEGRFREAIRHLENVLKSTPDDFESRFTLACIYAEDLNDVKSAEKHINKIQNVATISPSSREMARQRLSAWKKSPASGRKGQPVKPVMAISSYQPPSTPNPILEAEPAKAAAMFPPVEIEAGFSSHRTVEDLCRAGNYGSAMQMLETMLAEKPEDLTGWAMKARIYVQYLAQPWQADKAMQRVMGATDIFPEQVEAVDQLAEAFTRTKDHSMKAGRLWRKLTEAPSVPVEQKVVILSRLKKWEAGAAAA